MSISSQWHGSLLTLWHPCCKGNQDQTREVKMGICHHGGHSYPEIHFSLLDYYCLSSFWFWNNFKWAFPNEMLFPTCCNSFGIDVAFLECISAAQLSPPLMIQSKVTEGIFRKQKTGHREASTHRLCSYLKGNKVGGRHGFHITLSFVHR